MRPSCGMPLLGDVELGHDLDPRDEAGRCRWRGTVVESNTTPSTRKRTRMSCPRGSKWMSEAPRRTASAITSCTSFTTGASSADSRSSITSASYSSSSSSCTALESAELLDQRVDVLGRRDRAAHLVAGRHRDVVEREQVRGVGRGHEEGVLRHERDRHGLVAARLLAVEQARGALVHVEDVQVHVLEAVALRERLGELAGVDDARLDQRLAERHSVAAAALHHPLHELALGETELHDDVPDAVLDAGALARRYQSRDGERPS